MQKTAFGVESTALLISNAEMLIACLALPADADAERRYLLRRMDARQKRLKRLKSQGR